MLPLWIMGVVLYTVGTIGCVLEVAYNEPLWFFLWAIVWFCGAVILLADLNPRRHK